MSKVAGVQSIFLLWHVHELGDGEDDEKLIGVYSSQEDAERAIGCLRERDLPGFRDFPDGFEISDYPINQDHWTEGYFTDRW